MTPATIAAGILLIQVAVTLILRRTTTPRK
jgi:hypothetical protein